MSHTERKAVCVETEWLAAVGKDHPYSENGRMTVSSCSSMGPTLVCTDPHQSRFLAADR